MSIEQEMKQGFNFNYFNDTSAFEASILDRLNRLPTTQQKQSMIPMHHELTLVSAAAKIMLRSVVESIEVPIIMKSAHELALESHFDIPTPEERAWRCSLPQLKDIGVLLIRIPNEIQDMLLKEDWAQLLHVISPTIFDGIKVLLTLQSEDMTYRVNWKEGKEWESSKLELNSRLPIQATFNDKIATTKEGYESMLLALFYVEDCLHFMTHQGRQGVQGIKFLRFYASKKPLEMLCNKFYPLTQLLRLMLADGMQIEDVTQKDFAKYSEKVKENR